MFAITMEQDGMQCKNKELTWKQGRPLISSSVTKRNLKVIENMLSLSFTIIEYVSFCKRGQRKNESKN